VTSEYAGPVPAQLDERVARRDHSELPAATVLRYQRIGLGKSPAHNLRWELDDDGSLRLARHSGDTSDWQTPFDTDLPSAPSTQLADDKVEKVRRALADAGFEGQPPYQVGERAKGGRIEIVTARTGGSVHEVMYENAENDLLNLLWEIEAEVGT
jgi:hypothetical protein